MVWNRRRFIKDPAMGKRQTRPSPESEWVIRDGPERRILDHEFWNAAKARQAAIKVRRGNDGREDETHFRGPPPQLPVLRDALRVLRRRKCRPPNRTHRTGRLSAGGWARRPSSVEQAGALWDVARCQRVLCHAFYIGLSRTETWNQHWDRLRQQKNRRAI